METRIRTPLPPGFQLDGYRIEQQIAVGGFGITYLAQQLAFERKVAIKEYLPFEIAVRNQDGTSVEPRSPGDAGDFEHGLARFRDEGKTLVSLQHPNIVSAYDFREANNTAYLVMQYVEGKNLNDLLREQSPLSERRIREILFPLLDGVEQVHAAGFLHRDIKPSNIIIRPDCTPVLVDFGAARKARGRNGENPTRIVTSGYAPIEQYSEGSKQGPWTDIYALGATLYYVITGAPPPDAVGRVGNDALVRAVEAGAGRYRKAFLSAIDRALARDAADRPQSIAEFRAIFSRAASTLAPLGIAKSTSAISTETVNLPRQKRLAAFVRAKPMTAGAPSEVKVWPGRTPLRPDGRRGPIAYHPLLRFALVNTAAFALSAAAYLQGWIDTVIKADGTGLTIAIGVVFLGGLVLSGVRAWTVARELGCVRNHDPCRRSWATRYLRAIAGRSAGSRAIVAAAMRANISSGIAAVRHIASSLVLLGLIGTVLGFIIALAGVEPKTVGSASAIGPMVGHLIEGMSVALYTTLVGAVLNLWLIVNYNSLARDATRFVTELVALGESNERTRSV